MDLVLLPRLAVVEKRCAKLRAEYSRVQVLLLVEQGFHDEFLDRTNGHDAKMWRF
jgi:hypothetical protein